MPVRFGFFPHRRCEKPSQRLKKRRVPLPTSYSLSAAVVLRHETMAALSMSAASISFGPVVADARARVSVRLPASNRRRIRRMRFIHLVPERGEPSSTPRWLTLDPDSPQAPTVNAVVSRQSLKTEAMVKVRGAERATCAPRRARHRKQINLRPVHTSALDLSPDSRSPPSSVDSLHAPRPHSHAFYRIIAIDPASVATVPPGTCRARRDGKAPIRLSRGTLLGRIKTWNAADLELSRRGTLRSPRSPLSPTGAWMVTHQKAVEPERPRHQGVAGEARSRTLWARFSGSP